MRYPSDSFMWPTFMVGEIFHHEINDAVQSTVGKMPCPLILYLILAVECCSASPYVYMSAIR